MTKRGFSFEFDIPDRWIQFNKNAQLVLQGPRDEEIIVSGWIVQGTAPETDVLTLREQIFQNALISLDSVV